MTHRVVSTDAAPAAIGAYSQAVVQGGFVFCSGQVALDPASGEMVGDTVTAQAERAMANLAGVLAAAGSGFEHVVRCTIFLVDMDDFAAVNEVYARSFPQNPPSRACVAVRALPKGALVEIDCIAAVAS